MELDVKLTYNDLKMFLSEKDIEDIENFPNPTIEQAKQMKKYWEQAYGNTLLRGQDRESLIGGIIVMKPYLKVLKEYPELFI